MTSRQPESRPMQHTITVSEGGCLFTITTQGDGNVEGIIAFFQDIISHRHWKPGNDLLLDHRELKIDQISFSGIKAVSTFFKSIAPELGGGKVALVMNREVDYGIARAWEIVTEGDVDAEIHVFRQLDQAVNWLRE